MVKLPAPAVALLLSLGLAGAACGSTEAASEPGQVASALDGEFATLGGGSIDLAELQGEDVVLWFWAPW